MKFFFLILLSLIVFTGQTQSNIDVLHYKHEIELNDNNDTIFGKSTIRFLLKKEVNEVIFDLQGKLEKSGKGMIITKTYFPKQILFTEAVPGNTSFENNKVRTTFWWGPQKDDTLSFAIEYKGIPADGLIISKSQFGKRTFFADNWPNRAHNWIPCVDDPGDKATVEFLVTAPSHYQVISNGVQIEETNLPGDKKLTHYKEDVPLPTKVMVIGAADFAVSTVANINCIPIYSWVYPENKTEGFTDYAMAKDILAFHINYIGPFPYKKLANVQSKTRFGGMENAGAIFYAEDRVNGRQDQEELLSHEIVHQWFGDMATEKSFAHLWLSEGFATYLTHLYIESKYGTDSLNNEMKYDRENVIGFVKRSRRPVVDSTPNYMQLLNANSYQKGSWVLHMLRRQLGDSVFKKSIRLYYATYAGKNAETKDLQKIFETVSGKNLEKFFKQWLYTPENISLDVTWKYNKSENNIEVTIKQLQSFDFEFPFEILIQESAVTMSKRMIKTISKRSETFAFPVKSKPVRIELDPMTSLLFEGKLTELK
ncbi:MAG: M1 family metallopeptidase [Chitinophagaceae bacterium]